MLAKNECSKMSVVDNNSKYPYLSHRHQCYQRTEGMFYCSTTFKLTQFIFKDDDWFSSQPIVNTKRPPSYREITPKTAHFLKQQILANFNLKKDTHSLI